MRAKIYHNPRCSKSRATLALLAARGVEIEVIDYLEHPLPRETLVRLLRKLGQPAIALVRTEEPEFAKHGARTLGDDDVLDLLVALPRLLQRPIVEIGARARIGRPPERALELLE
jgi:arsenate reductase